MSIKTVNNIEMYYEIHGAGEPVLLIHGLGSSSKDWEYQIDDLAKYYQVITLDVRGHGRSTKAAGNYSIKLFADDISTLMSSLNIQSFHVVGLSMGGMIAFQLAVAHPQLLKSMVIVNSGPGFVNANLKIKLKIKLRLFMLIVLPMKSVAKTIAAGLFPANAQQALRDLFVQRFCENDKQSYLKSMRALIKWNVCNELNKISCPSLILSADQDYTSVKSKQEYASQMIRAELQVIKNSHHALPVEKPAEFNQAVLHFLQRH